MQYSSIKLDPSLRYPIIRGITMLENSLELQTYIVYKPFHYCVSSQTSRLNKSPVLSMVFPPQVWFSYGAHYPGEGEWHHHS